MKLDLSVVLLCYRAGEGMRESVREMSELLAASVPNYELVLVANYLDPTDPSPAIARELAAANPHIRAVTERKQGMFGWDVKSGVAAATGAYVAYIDGDGQMPFRDVVRAYEAMRATPADIVTTYRTHRGDALWRTIVSHLYNALFQIMFPGAGARDVNAKPKLFSRETFARLNPTSDDWFIDAEIIILARRTKMRVMELPTVFNKLEGRRSFVKPMTIVEFLRNLATFRIKEFLV